MSQGTTPPPSPAERHRARHRTAVEMATARMRGKLAREIDPDNKLPPDVLAERVDAALRKMRSEWARAAGRSAKANRATKAKTQPPPTPPPIDNHAIPREILDSPSGRAALADRDIGAVYRILRRGGVSQRRIAALTGHSQGDVSGLINGHHQVHSIDVLQRIATGLDVPLGWMGLAWTVPRAHAECGDTEEADVLRRQMIDLLAIGSAAVLGVPTLTDAAALPAAAGAETAPPLDADTIRAQTAAWRALDHEHGGGAVVRAVSASAGALSGRLDQTKLPPSRDVLAEVAHQHALAGAVAADADQLDLARAHLHTALTLAGQSGQPRLVAWVLDDIGRMEMSRSPDDALKAYQLAGARTGVWPVLHTLMATCYAQLGHDDQARWHLAQAAEGADDPGVSGQAGHALVRLGDYPSAAAHLERSLAARDETDTRARCLELASLAAAHLCARHLDAGTRHAEQALALAGSLQSASARAGLRSLADAAGGLQDSTCRDIAHQARALTTPG